MACRSPSRVAGCCFGPPLAALLKERLPAFGPPRDSFGRLLGLLDGGQQRAGQGLDGQGISPNHLDQFAQLDGLL